jgi:hypothetical protein
LKFTLLWRESCEQPQEEFRHPRSGPDFEREFESRRTPC